MPRQLSITPAPFKSSNLAIPPSPFSPKLPISPPPSPPPYKAPTVLKPKIKLQLAPAPAEPLHWLWQCHVCNRVYQLGVTRRCLDDGHHFCAGTTTVKRSKRNGNKKIVRHKACASEFDYQGWKGWGEWRRSVAEQLEAAEALTAALADYTPQPLFTPVPPTEGQWLKGTWAKKASIHSSTTNHWHKDCWNSCDYPSECRWGKQYGVQAPTKPTVTVPSSPPPTPPRQDRPPATSFDDILLDVPALDTDTDSLERVESHSDSVPESPENAEKKPDLDDLLQSAQRRKRRSAGYTHSPLASNPPSPATAGSPSTTQTLQRAFDDFELDVRRSIERAGGLLNGFVHSLKSSAALEEDKAEAFVKGLRVSKKKGSEPGSSS